MFSMFFGSGNLVFPLTVGKDSDGHFLFATLGMLLTGVLVPFLGVIAMMLLKGDTKSFFGSMGKHATFWLPLIILSLMGPFGVLARCLTVAHGSFRLVFPETSLIVFSAISCVIIYYMTTNKSRIVPILGNFLTPFLLIALFLVTLFGFWYGTSQEHVGGTAWNALTQGVLQGYQTMDLLAAFFFSTFVIQHLEKLYQNENEHAPLFKVFFKSTLLGAFLLSIVYFGLVYLGALYGPSLEGVPPQEMLGTIASKTLGSFSAPIVCITVVLACFTTAIVLASLFASFLFKEVFQGKVSENQSMLITLLIAFAISTLEFAGIARFIGPILECLYPALIVLTMINIANKLWGMKQRRWPVALTLLAKLCTL